MTVRFRHVVLIGIVSFLLLVGGGFLYVLADARRPLQPVYPDISADRSPGALARGEQIFRSACLSCHHAPGDSQAAGASARDVPPLLGEFFARNLTSHPEAGIAQIGDEVIAGVIRHGILSSGRRSMMPTFPLTDADLAALLGFLRSSHPLLTPNPRVQPPSRPSAVGRLALARVQPVHIPEAPPGPTREYGRYLAHAVYGCAQCHTPGSLPDKTLGPEAFAGGLELVAPNGARVVSSNLTRDVTGLYRWTFLEFVALMRKGQRPDGTEVYAPMPLYPAMSETELRALWALLRVQWAKHNEVLGARPVDWSKRRTPPPLPESTPVTPPPDAAPAAQPLKPAELFVRLACQACHGKGRSFHAQLVAGRAKDLGHLERWIRNAPSVKPGTAMPSFQSQMSEEQARSLAKWIKTTPVDKLP